MPVINKTNKNDKRSQKGRSMVEMLGVLAIVGVLSVGGVYGYGVAMKKHKANELLHQASMLATTISAQAMTNNGALPQTITSFGNSSYGTFSTSVSDALNGKGFSITIKNVDSGACTQLEKMAGGMVREATCDGTTATITYYKNLATNDEEGKAGIVGSLNNSEEPLVEYEKFQYESEMRLNCISDGNMVFHARSDQNKKEACYKPSQELCEKLNPCGNCLEEGTCDSTSKNKMVTPNTANTITSADISMIKGLPPEVEHGYDIDKFDNGYTCECLYDM